MDVEERGRRRNTPREPKRGGGVRSSLFRSPCFSSLPPFSFASTDSDSSFIYGWLPTTLRLRPSKQAASPLLLPLRPRSFHSLSPSPPLLPRLEISQTNEKRLMPPAVCVRSSPRRGACPRCLQRGTTLDRGQRSTVGYADNWNEFPAGARLFLASFSWWGGEGREREEGGEEKLRVIGRLGDDSQTVSIFRWRWK